jgi:hypothetical protein
LLFLAETKQIGVKKKKKKKKGLVSNESQKKCGGFNRLAKLKPPYLHLPVGRPGEE